MNLKNKPSIVLVDDDSTFLATFTQYMLAGKTVDTYDNPLNFLANITKYNKETKIILDNQFNSYDLTGVDLANRLHGLGYRHLYLLTGHKPENCPQFLIPILKTDLDHIQRIFGD